MADRGTEPWYPTAAYLYVLHLDGPALAWEYLRRHPEYRLDWLRRGRRPQPAHQAAHLWGLRLLEDPELDARDAHPAWFPDHDGVLQLYPDADPPMDAIVFAFWSLPGSKCLSHDGKRLMLVLRWPGYSLRLAIAPGLADGMAFAYAIRACAQLQGLNAMLQKLATAADATPAAAASVASLAVVPPRWAQATAMPSSRPGASAKRRQRPGLRAISANTLPSWTSCL